MEFQFLVARKHVAAEMRNLPRNIRLMTERAQESIATTNPSFVGADASTRDHAVQVRMGKEVLSPGVQQRETADSAPRCFGSWVSVIQRFGSGTEQHPVDDSAILKRQRSELVRQREHDMEVLHIENFSLSRALSQAARAAP